MKLADGSVQREVKELRAKVETLERAQEQASRQAEREIKFLREKLTISIANFPHLMKLADDSLQREVKELREKIDTFEQAQRQVSRRSCFGTFFM
eukprot:jgi/Bigna1/137647/aug1.40_g12355